MQTCDSTVSWLQKLYNRQWIFCSTFLQLSSLTLWCSALKLSCWRLYRYSFSPSQKKHALLSVICFIYSTNKQVTVVARVKVVTHLTQLQNLVSLTDSSRWLVEPLSLKREDVHIRLWCCFQCGSLVAKRKFFTTVYMHYWNTNALFSTKLILFEPLCSIKNPKIDSSRIFHIKFIIMPAVLYLLLKYTEGLIYV